MTSAELIAIAAAEVGYKEKKTNSQLDDFTANAGSGNMTKYSRDLHQAGYYGGHSKQGFAWCCCFTDWCFLQAAGGDKTLAQNISCQSGIYGAACNYSSNYYKQAKRFGSEPRKGAQIYFLSNGSYVHTGIVEDFDSKYVYTIEGNASNSVCRKKYARSNKSIAGYGYPCYSDDATCSDPSEPAEKKPNEREDATLVTITTFKLRMGSRGNAVQTLQALLNHWADANLEIDGSFGPLTEQAVLKYQQKNSLDIDGIVGKQTWTALLN